MEQPQGKRRKGQCGPRRWKHLSSSPTIFAQEKKEEKEKGLGKKRLNKEEEEEGRKKKILTRKVFGLRNSRPEKGGGEETEKERWRKRERDVRKSCLRPSFLSLFQVAIFSYLDFAIRARILRRSRTLKSNIAKKERREPRVAKLDLLLRNRDRLSFRYQFQYFFILDGTLFPIELFKKYCSNLLSMFYYSSADQ